MLLQLRDLEYLTIDSCKSMESVFNLHDLDDACVYNLSQPSLQVNLNLRNLPKLKMIWNKNPDKILRVFKLRKLEVLSCDELEHLFSSSMSNVGHLSIASCKAMEEIFLEDKNDDQETEDGVAFQSLTHLNISNMENLKTFSYGNRDYQFPSLTLLMISSCPKMKTFVSIKDEKDETMMSKDVTANVPFFNAKVFLPCLEKLVLHSMMSMGCIWDNNLSKDSFCKLASIEIKECELVATIFHSHLVERLQNLTTMEVENCDLLEELFGYGDRKLTYSKLQEVRLLKLEKLSHVVRNHSSQGEALTFPCLREIYVEECANLISICPEATARSLSELRKMYISSCQGLKEVISFDGEEENKASIQAMRFKNLTSLQLENLNNLVHFCLGYYELYFPFLKKLLIIGCEKLKAFVLRSTSDGFKEQSQEITPTNNIEDASSPLFDEKVIFPNLQELQIRGLILKEIWPKNEPTSFLMDLKVLSIEDCHQLSIIIPSRMLPNLQRLESVSVKSCTSVEVIFEHGKHSSRRQNISRIISSAKMLERLRELNVSSCELVQHIVAKSSDDRTGETYCSKIIFPQLSSLKFSNLPGLCNFIDKNLEIDLPQLIELEIKDCHAVEVLASNSTQSCKPLLLIEKVEFPRLESLVINNMHNLKELWHISKEATNSECSLEAFCKLKRLEVVGCNSLLTVFPCKMIRAFLNLEELTVVECKSLESIFESPRLMSRPESGQSDDLVRTVFALRELTLWWLPQMTHVWNVEDPTWVYLSFEKLHAIRILNCDSITHLFPASIAKCLHQLFELMVFACKEMKEIVWNEESAHHQFMSTPAPGSANISHPLELEWPSLAKLHLYMSPSTKIFASEQQKVDIPRLDWMVTDASTLEKRQFLDEIYANPTILDLRFIKNKEWVGSIPWLLLLDKFPSLRTIRVEHSDSKEIFPSDNGKEGEIVPYKPEFLDIAKVLEIVNCHHLTILPKSLTLFHNLKEITVWKCNGLRHLVTSSAARSLVHLTELFIDECNSLEEIVTYDRDENGNISKDDDGDISFPRLNCIEIRNLPSLRSFSSTNCNFNFPSLRLVYMRNLPEMHIFCEGGFNTPYKQRITRSVRALYNQEVNFCRIRPGD